MNKISAMSFPFLVIALAVPHAHGQNLTDSATPPTNANITYAQPEHGTNGVGTPDALNGIGEEFTLSSSDPTLELTNLYVKSSGGQNSAGSSGALDWTLNLYDLTDNKQRTLVVSSTAVMSGEYLDFALTPAESATTKLMGGDTYAFTVTTSASYHLSGILKSDETPANFLPPGITSELAVTGNGDGSSLEAFDDTDFGMADITYYLQTEMIPEPLPGKSVLLGLASLVFLYRFRRRKALL